MSSEGLAQTEFSLDIPLDYVYYQKPDPIDVSGTKEKFDIYQYSFNDDQKAVVDAAIKFVNGELKTEDENGNQVPAKALTIMGYAGTGKTFTSTRVMRHFLQNMGLRVCVTAPTNKAVRILNDNTEFIHHKLVFSTIHRQFAIKPVQNDYTGKEEFVRDYNAEITIHTFNVLIVDEVSMLDDQLFQYIWEVVESSNLKVIFIGDPAQIPPVNHADSIPLSPTSRKEFHIASATLKTIVRQAAENPILRVAGEVRENAKRDAYRPSYQTEIINNSGTIVLSRLDTQKIYEIAERFFVNEIFHRNPDFMKIIAWRNDVVDAANAKIRSFIYGTEKPDKIMLEERLIVDVPIKLDETSYIPVNTELKVTKVSTGQFTLRAQLAEKLINAKFYNIEFDYLSQSNKPLSASCRVIHEDSEKEYTDLVKRITKMAKAEPDKWAKKALWREMFALRDQFAWVKYNYAITAHKSQGSTYDNAMILDWDISLNPKPEERNRIKYVAITRPKKYLFIVK